MTTKKPDSDVYKNQTILNVWSESDALYTHIQSFCDMCDRFDLDYSELAQEITELKCFLIHQMDLCWYDLKNK